MLGINEPPVTIKQIEVEIIDRAWDDGYVTPVLADRIRTLLAQADAEEAFLLVLAAEGTRTKGRVLEVGFSRISRTTKLPISLAFIDGPSRTSGFGPTFTATTDVVADMDLVRAFYADKRGIHPERRTEPRLREEG